LFSPYQTLAFYEMVWNFFFIALLYTYDQTLRLLGWAMFFFKKCKEPLPVNKQNINLKWDANNTKMF